MNHRYAPRRPPAQPDAPRRGQVARPGARSAEHPGHRDELTRPRGGDGSRTAGVAVLVQQATDVHRRAGQPDVSTTVSDGGLRGRAGHGHRAALSARPGRHAPSRSWRLRGINDVSARDWRWRSPPSRWASRSTAMRPAGPSYVTGDELGDPGGLGIRTWVNDELRAGLHDGRPDLRLRRHDRVPRDHVPARAPRHDHRHRGPPPASAPASSPPKFLADGDVVRIAIEGVGSGGPP